MARVKWIEEAFRELYPEKDFHYECTLKYSGKFSGYNANVRQYMNQLDFRLSKEWRGVSKDIVIGLLQTLLSKLYKAKKRTQNMDLYDIFLKKVHISVEKHTIEPELEAIFDELNELHFNGMLETPNLVWGSASTRKLGHYEYGSDTIMVSTVLQQAPEELLKLVMFHEMLHKKLKYSSKNGRSYHHTPEFKRLERNYPEFERLDKELHTWLGKHKLKKAFSRWF